VIAIELKFYQNIEKLLRDGYKYVQCCLLCLVENVNQMMPQMIQQVEAAFSAYVNGDHSLARLNEPQSRGLKKVFKGSKSDFGALRGPLMLLLAMQEMLQSAVFKSKICKGPFIQFVSRMLKLCGPGTENLADRDNVVEEFRKSLFLCAEGMSSSNKILLNQHRDIIDHLLPVLIDKIGSECADVRFFSLKTFTDLITQYLNDDKIYNQATGIDPQIMASSQAITELILKKLLQHYGIILTDKDPVPLFGLKLLSVIVERN
jgi:hypothetical protein